LALSGGKSILTVETVSGPIDDSELGITSCHEHLLVDTSAWYMKPKTPIPSKISDLKDPFTSLDNLKLTDESLIIQELSEFKKYGGQSIVDLTCTPSLGRNPIALKRISEATGVNIILGTGWYLYSTHPPYVKQKTIDELSDIMVKELTEGIEDTGIKAGVIGELGCGMPNPFHPEEERVLRAGCRTQRRTKVCFTIHPLQYDLSLKKWLTIGNTYVDLIEDEGADVEKFFLSHSDETCYNLDYHKSLLERGVTLSYDTFGAEWGFESLGPGARYPSDAERIEAIVSLCKQGYDKQLLLSHDVCFKMYLKKYGGRGYSHILENIIPQLENKGVSRKQINQMLIENPKRLLSKS